MSKGLRLRLLGPLEIELNGEAVTKFRSSKTQALLVYLAVTGRAHSRATLAGLLWGAYPEQKARASLSQSLTNLRRLVGPYLQISRRTIVFNQTEPHWLDVAQLEACFANHDHASIEPDLSQLEAVVDLYRGDFLEGFFVSDALEFEQWLLLQRTRLRKLALQVLHILINYYGEQGPAGYWASIDYITRLLMIEPWREEAHRQMMSLLAQTGQRGAALAQYETCRRVLVAKFGVEPGEETQALFERIRDE